MCDLSLFLSLLRHGWNMMKCISPLGMPVSSVPVVLHRAWCPFSQHLSSWTRRTSCTQRALSWRALNTMRPVLHSPMPSRYQWTIFPIYIFTRHDLISLLDAYVIKCKLAGVKSLSKSIQGKDPLYTVPRSDIKTNSVLNLLGYLPFPAAIGFVSNNKKLAAWFVHEWLNNYYP